MCFSLVTVASTLPLERLSLAFKLEIESTVQSDIYCRGRWDQVILRGSRANQATSYDIKNASLHKPSNIIQTQQQETKSVIISERNTQHTTHFLKININ